MADQQQPVVQHPDFSNFGSLKSTEMRPSPFGASGVSDFSNFGSLKSTEIQRFVEQRLSAGAISAISAR